MCVRGVRENEGRRSFGELSAFLFAVLVGLQQVTVSVQPKAVHKPKGAYLS